MTKTSARCSQGLGSVRTSPSGILGQSMPKPLEFTLLARDDFKTGDRGWTTSEGVIKVVDPFTGQPEGTIPVRAIETVPARRYGRFIEISPDPDVH
jgi:hypothetical protein